MGDLLREAAAEVPDRVATPQHRFAVEDFPLTGKELTRRDLWGERDRTEP